MNPEAADYWDRAIKAFKTGAQFFPIDPDAAASRAFYAAFYAVTALFALEDKNFSRHSALEVAVHRELVKAGRWPKELGADYSMLLQVRGIGDYGGRVHVNKEGAIEALRAAFRIIQAVQKAAPQSFSIAESLQVP